MTNLKSKFEKWLSKFNSKKEKFKKTIEKWQAKGKTKLYNQGSSLVQEIETLSNELQQDFVSGKEQDKTLIKNKIKKFKKLYKELNEIVKPIWQQWIEAIVVAGVLVFAIRTFIFGLYHVPTGSAEPTILVGDRIWGNKFVYFVQPIKYGEIIICDDPEFVYDKSNPIKYYWQKYVGFGIPILGLPDGPTNWTKTIIGVPGDIIEGKIENGKTAIYRNGKKLDETGYVNPYPLISLKKTTGFIDMDKIGPFAIPSFLRKKTEKEFCTYDPNKSLQDQPFYNMTEEEIIKNPDGTPVLLKPYTPTYIYSSSMFGDYSQSIDSFGPIKIPKGHYWAMGNNRKNSHDSRRWGFLPEDLIHGRVSFVIYSIDSNEPIWLFEFIKHPIDFFTKSVRWNRFFKPIKNDIKKDENNTTSNFI
ncbi:signal peptidase I [Candidatus Dependentiae bacterium]|nr:signal peptidase I [Candidatus Dependentiae bacterium]